MHVQFLFASMHGISKDAFQEYFCNIAFEIIPSDAYPAATECNKIISVFEAPFKGHMHHQNELIQVTM